MKRIAVCWYIASWCMNLQTYGVETHVIFYVLSFVCYEIQGDERANVVKPQYLGDPHSTPPPPQHNSSIKLMA